MFDFTGKVALVTGAARGIGASIVRHLAQQGALVVAANRLNDDLKSLLYQCHENGLVVHGAEFAATAPDCKALVDEVVRTHGRLDILIHNAGGCKWSSLECLTEDNLEAALALNLKSCFWLTKAALPHMKATGGKIVLTSSVTGPRVAMAGATHYAAAKAGVNGFIKSAALELAEFGITVNGVEPGLIAKDRGRLSDPYIKERITDFIPLGRPGKPDDIACAMLYFASEHAGWVTGQTLVVDGGMTLPESGYAMEELRASIAARGQSSKSSGAQK